MPDSKGPDAPNRSVLAHCAVQNDVILHCEIAYTTLVHHLRCDVILRSNWVL